MSREPELLGQTVVVVGGRPYYTTLADTDFAQARREVDEHLWLTLHVAREAAGKMRPGGTLLFISGTDARRPRVGGPIVSALTAGLPALIANLALELGPVRVNLIAAGFVDTPLSAALLGDQLDERRKELRATLRIGRVVGPEDVAALAIHLMTNKHGSHGCDVRHRRRPAARLIQAERHEPAAR